MWTDGIALGFTLLRNTLHAFSTIDTRFILLIKHYQIVTRSDTDSSSHLVS
jgi:hypothetical protein